MIYTTGFGGQNIEELKPLLERLDARLIDIRFAPAAQPLKWSKGYLRLLLKRSYLHVPALGNRPFKPGISAVQNLTLGLKILDEQDCNILLLCECKMFDNCHRKIISQALAGLGKETIEIDDWTHFRSNF